MVPSTPAFVATLQTIANDPKRFVKGYPIYPEKISYYSPARISLAIALSIITFLSYRREARPVVVTSLFLATTAAAALAGRQIYVENPKYIQQKETINNLIQPCIDGLNRLFEEKNDYIKQKLAKNEYEFISDLTNAINETAKKYNARRQEHLTEEAYTSVIRSAKKLTTCQLEELGGGDFLKERLRLLRSTCDKLLHGEK